MNMIKSVLFVSTFLLAFNKKRYFLFIFALQTCLVAAVSADAEADAAYLGYGYPYAHGVYGYAAHVPFGSSTGLDPITQGLDPVTQIGSFGLRLGICRSLSIMVTTISQTIVRNSSLGHWVKSLGDWV